MAPPQHNAPVLVRAAEILAQVGEELAFVEAGKDTGLLPINSLVMDFEELPREGAPAVLATGLAAVRALLDQILDGPGKFTGESIRFLNEWHSWMSSVLTAWERGGEMPAGSGGVEPVHRGRRHGSGRRLGSGSIQIAGPATGRR